MLFGIELVESNVIKLIDIAYSCIFEIKMAVVTYEDYLPVVDEHIGHLKTLMSYPWFVNALTESQRQYIEEGMLLTHR